MLFTAIAFTVVFLITESFASSHDIPKHFVRPRQSVNTGSCGSVQINFSTVNQGQPTTLFQPANQQDFSHGPSKNIEGITSFICSRLKSPCNAPTSTINLCNQAAASTSGQEGGQGADNWNSAFGIQTNFGGNNQQKQPTTTTTTPQQAQQKQTTTTAQTTTPGQVLKVVNNQVTTTTAAISSAASRQVITTVMNNDAAGGGQQAQGGTAGLQTLTLEQVNGTWQPVPTDTSAAQTIDVVGALESDGCILQAVLVTLTLTGSAAEQTGNQQTNGLVSVPGFTPFNLGRCTDPTIAFGEGLGDRQANEWAFMNHDVSQFDHGSTLDIATIAEFTCNNLVNNCGLSTNAAAVSQCNSGQAAAVAIGNRGSAADAFNRAMGFATYYAAVDGSG